MLRYILQRIVIFPIGLLIANFLGYAYAYYISPIQLARNPYTFGNFSISPVFPEYFEYLKGVTQFDFGVLPQGGNILEIIVRAGIASLWLLALALMASIVLGLVLGFSAVRISPPRVSFWLTGMITIGLASPSYYVGIVLIALSIVYVIWGPNATPLVPFQGYGIDAHLVLPTLALMVLPTVKIAQITSTMLAGEMDKQYVVAAHSFGHTMQAIRRRFAFRNILAAVIITIVASLRLMIAELIIVERLFDWPGIGRLFSSTLVLTHRSDIFLFPPLLAALLTILAAVFLLSDFVAGILVRYFDPRQAG
jgi:peptide/nickel transport system permease protein